MTCLWRIVDFAAKSTIRHTHPLYLPVPAIGTDCGPLLALSSIIAAPLTVPGTDGENCTRTEHFCFGASELQLVATEKEPAPEILAPLNTTVAPPSREAVLTRFTTFVLLCPTLTFPKFTEAADILKAADTFGVGVGDGVGVGVDVAVGVGELNAARHGLLANRF